ncbi:MAG: outer rane efflux protein [Bacteroidetes bacterium]|nr:outer rane efflux protein [Bacteroidota bacterium]
MKYNFLLWGLLLVAPASSAQTTEKLSLNDALTIALNNNAEISATEKEIDAASGRILQAGRIPNPELSVTFNEVPTNFSFGDAGEKDIGLSQAIEFPGKRGSRVEVAEHGRSIAEFSLLRAKAIVAASCVPRQSSRRK